MYHKTPPPSPQALVALRPAGAHVPRASVLDLCNIAVQLDELLHLKGLDATTGEQWAALWCADPLDTFGMLDDFEARLGLDAKGVAIVRQQLCELLPETVLVDLLAHKFGEYVREELGAKLSHVEFLNRTDPEAIAGRICHSHDFTDTNECMIAAQDFLGISHDFDDNADCERNARMTNAAWSLSKSRGFADAETYAGYRAFLDAFPQTVREYSTGGGCMAWHLKCAKGYILVTADDDPSEPLPSDEAIGVGYYQLDDAGDYLDDGEHPNEALTWREAIEWVRERLTR